MDLTLSFYTLLGLLIGAAIIFAYSRSQVTALNERLQSKENQILELKKSLDDSSNKLSCKDGELIALNRELAQAKTSLSHEQQRITELSAIEEKFTQAFKALSLDALNSNNQSFIELAKGQLSAIHEVAKGDLEKRQQAIGEIVKPVRESLEKFDNKINELEKARVGAYEGLTTQVKSLIETQSKLHTETGNLVKALGSPRVRGQWGEIQLKRVVELAGMLEHCDFSEQHSVNTEEGRLRPDMIVHLPGGKTIVVDAKAPLGGYLDALEAKTDEARKAGLDTHARQIFDHAKKLSEKSYWAQFEHAPEFAVLFLPGEAFFSAALESRPELIEQSVSNGVIIATPTTLIALLKAVAFGWRQEALADNAAHISELGKELYSRIASMADSFSSVGNSLGKAVDSYNKAVGSLENRVLPQARRFKELAISSVKEIEVINTIDSAPRSFQTQELVVSNEKTVD